MAETRCDVPMVTVLNTLYTVTGTIRVAMNQKGVETE